MLEASGQDFESVHVSVEDGMWPEYADPAYRMPDQIDVMTQEDDNIEGYDDSTHLETSSHEHVVSLQLHKFSGEKAYLGGYRNKLSGLVYHHADTQTPSERGGPVVRDLGHLRTRETQTFETRTVSVQPYRECGTQMERIDLVLDDRRDVDLIPGKYFTAEELLELRRVNTITIQRIWRGHMAKNRADDIRHRNEQCEIELLETREEELSVLREEKMKEMQERLHPRSEEQFTRLYNELDAWRRAEVVKIKDTYGPGDDRRRAMTDLLSTETRSLQDIERLKSLAAKEQSSEKTKKFLELLARPQRWQLSGGGAALVQTPQSLHAAELLTLYEALSAPVSTATLRLEVLAQAQKAVEQHQSPLTLDMLTLIDREADLLSRNRALTTMVHLRIRLANLFLQFVEDPRYNHRASEFVKY